VLPRTSSRVDRPTVPPGATLYKLKLAGTWARSSAPQC
jgi:hypothetical protein